MSSERPEATATHLFEGPLDERRADEAARALREQTAEIIHLPTSSGSSGDVKLHVPENPDGDDTEVVCEGMVSHREPARKEVTCFPTGWIPWCSRCAVSVLDELDVPPGVPIQAIPDAERGDD